MSDRVFYADGKKRRIPKKNHTLPKKKRLRKKKFWLHCKDCNNWFKRYEQSHATLRDGGKICSSCLEKRLQARIQLLKGGH